MAIVVQMVDIDLCEAMGQYCYIWSFFFHGYCCADGWHWLVWGNVTILLHLIIFLVKML